MQQRAISRGGKSLNYTLPAPVGGLNVRDSYDKMAETDAIVMDNYIPSDTKVVLRRGYRLHASLTGIVRTLAEYKVPGEERFLAFAGGTAYNITTAAALKNYQKSFKENAWQCCQFNNRLILVNGSDKPQCFYVQDGEEHFEDAAFSGEGLAAEKLVNVCVSKRRLFFVEKGSLNAWYSENAGEVQGTLLKLDFSTVTQCGGELTAVASWTQDGGQGIDDLTVFLTSEGEVLVYAGSDPSDYADWSLRGVYRMSRPVGYRCTLPYQGDVVIISESGYVPLSKALPLEAANSSQTAFSDKIRGLVAERMRQNRTKSGWQAVLYQRGGYAIFNVPAAQQFEQHVINVNTGAWCRFTNIRSFCWGIFDGRAYFGGENGVYLFDEGYSDNKTHICGKIAQAYSALGTQNLKKVQMLNPRTKSSTRYALVVYTNTDFDDRERAYAENIGSDGMTKWNAAPWSSLANPVGTKWATLKGRIRSQWIGNAATGFRFSLVFQTKTRGNLIEWYDTGFRYEQGGGIL